MQDLATKLAAYVDEKLDPEDEIAVDDLIVRYVDGKLDPEIAAEIKAAMEANPAVADHIAVDIRAAKTVKEQVVPVFEAIEVPPNPALDKALAEMIADPKAWGDQSKEAEQADVVPFSARSPARQAFIQPTWGKMAASIVALLAVGGGVYLYDLRGDDQREQQLASLDAEVREVTEARLTERNELTRQVTASQIRLNDATAAREDMANQLVDASAAIERLDANQAELSDQLAAATDEAAAAQAARDRLEEQIASLDADARQAADARVTERDELTRQVTALQSRLDDATTARSELDTQLAQADATIERLSADQAGLSDQLAAATDEASAAQAARDRLEQQIASLDADARQAAEARVTERDELTRQVTALETRLDAATSQRDEVDAQLAQAREAIAALDADKSNLSDQLANLGTQLTTVTTARDTAASQAAALETEMAGLRSDLAEAVLTQETTQARLAAAVEQGQQRVVALENDLDVAEQQIAELDQAVAGLNRTNNLLLTEAERLRKEGSWIAQVVGYHRGYAGTMREVEVSAEQQEEKQALTKWLGSTFGRSFTVPELDGLTFIGGRVFFVSGIPTGQIAYHDAEGRLTGFCFTPSPDDQTSEPIEGRDDDLNLVYWRKGAFHYVLVGWAESDQLKPLAAELQQTYGEDT